MSGTKSNEQNKGHVGDQHKMPTMDPTKDPHINQMNHQNGENRQKRLLVEDERDEVRAQKEQRKVEDSATQKTSIIDLQSNQSGQPQSQPSQASQSQPQPPSSTSNKRTINDMLKYPKEGITQEEG